MPQDKVGQVRVSVLHQVGELLDVFNKVLPAVPYGKKAEVGIAGNRSAVADMVVPADDKAETAQIFCKSGITRKIFAHAVGQLHDTAQLGLFRRQDIVCDIGHTVRAFINILGTLDIHIAHIRSAGRVTANIIPQNRPCVHRI